jgi:hypothetical protein
LLYRNNRSLCHIYSRKLKQAFDCLIAVRRIFDCFWRQILNRNNFSWFFNLHEKLHKTFERFLLHLRSLEAGQVDVTPIDPHFTCNFDMARLDFSEWLFEVAEYALSLPVIGRCFCRLLLDL